MTPVQASNPQLKEERLTGVASHNGAAAAAILSAGIASILFAVLTITSDHSIGVKTLLTFYKPTGPLSGETTVTVVAWVGVWGVLEWLWQKRDVPLKSISLISFILFGLALLGIFPPISDLF